MTLSTSNTQTLVQEPLGFKYHQGSGAGSIGGSAPVVAPQEAIVRRLMPVEFERLQGFPDGYTDVEFRGKPASDTARYKALGNSMAVPCMRWIGERIAMVKGER